MTRNENPALGGASVHTLRPGSPSTQQFTGNAHPQPQTIEISEQGAAYIDNISNGLASRQIELWQLPPALHWFFTRAWIQGRESRDAEVARLNFEADYWYFRASNPRADFYRHAESELWRQAVAA